MSDIGCQCELATILYVDNQSTIRLAKHIDIRYHRLRETSEAKEIRVEYAPSESQRADIFTKALPKEHFFSHSESIRLSEYEIKH